LILAPLIVIVLWLILCPRGGWLHERTRSAAGQRRFERNRDGMLVVGFVAIKTRRIKLHSTMMLSALALSAAFLGSYLYYHFAVRTARRRTMKGNGWRSMARS